VGVKAQGVPSITVDEELQGEPVQAGGLTLEPVARLRGRIWAQSANGQGGIGRGAAAFVRIAPDRVVVRGGAEGDRVLSITDVTAQSLRGIGFGMLGVAGVCLLLIVIRKLLR
jgi:hypothetical protein